MALWFPQLSTDRLQRHEQSQAAAAPLVAIAKVKNAIVLQAVDRKATALGLRIGQPLANARAMLPELEVAQADEAADLQLLNNIADWCDHFTPFVALDGKQGLLLDVTGATHLFGGEQTMLELIVRKLKAQGLNVCAGLAGTAAAAHALAIYKNNAITEIGAEAAAVKPLPVEALGLEAAITHAFRRAGLKTVGQVASRKRSEITARFGAVVLATVDEILGQGAKPISPRRPRAAYWQERAFAEPIATDDLITATLKSLSMSLSALMQENGDGARCVEALFFRADGVVRNITIAMGSPTRDFNIMLRLFREKLDALNDPLDPSFGFDLIRLSATRTEHFNGVTVELDSDLMAQKEINFLIDRLATRFGANRILRFQPNDTHIPEKAFIAVPAQRVSAKQVWKKRQSTSAIPHRPLRIFARPEPITFTTTLNWRRFKRSVIWHEGPERIAAEWWHHEEPQSSRDYFRAEDHEGRRYWLYRNTTTEQWFLHGIFA